MQKLLKRNILLSIKTAGIPH